MNILPQTKADGVQNTYIIIILGDYSTLESDGAAYTIDLQCFGIIEIILDDNSAQIKINGEIYQASKKEIITDPKTELLCHTWYADTWGGGLSLLMLVH